MLFIILFVCNIALLQSEEIRVAFGSCFYTSNPVTPIFKRVNEFQPDVFVWLGDAAYVDRLSVNGFSPELNETHVTHLFNITKNLPDYLALKKSIRIEGIWDDHDYNNNDGDKYNPSKQMIRQKYLDFLDVSAESHRRTNQNGIYYSFVIGDKLKVQVILLDVRWNRDPKHSPPESDMLGQAQWTWFEQEMKDSQADLILIGSGSQIIQDDKPSVCETWFESSRQRLYSLIKQSGKRVLLLTGDVHFAEIAEHPCGQELTNQKIFEITSSGIAFSWQQSYFIQLFEVFVKILNAYTYNSFDDRFVGLNFGALTIDEQNIQVEIRNHLGLPVLTKTISLSSLDHNIHEQSQLCKLHQNRNPVVSYLYQIPLKIYLLMTLPIFKWLMFFGSVYIYILSLIVRKIIKRFKMKKQKTL